MNYRILFLAAALAAGSTLSAQAPRAAASCQDYQALSHLAFEDEAKGYMGPVYAKLGDEVLLDDGTKIATIVPPTSTVQDGVIVEWGARYKTDFGNGDSFTVEVIIASYEQPPVFGTYRSWQRIVEGTGRFKDATGTFYESGPFYAWLDAKGIHSRYSGKATGKICGVKPKAK